MLEPLAVIGRIRLSEHPKNHIRLAKGLLPLKIGIVANRQVVVGDHYSDGVLGVFVREHAQVPRELLVDGWLWNDRAGKGRLSGPCGDVVKARNLGDVLSEGLFFGKKYFQGKTELFWARWNETWVEGQDVADELDIVEVKC